MDKRIFLILFISILLFFFSCRNNEDNKFYQIRIGHIGDFDIKIWNSIYDELKKENISVEIVLFSDYTGLNTAVNDGYIDLNHFQHYAYFVNETNKNDYYLDIVEKTFIASMNMYSRNLTNIGQISTGSKIAVPNDDVNFSRALKILDSIGFIKLKKKKDDLNYNYSMDDVIENYLKLEFVHIKANDMYSYISSVDAAIVNYSINSDFKNENVLYYDDPTKYSSDMYVNLIVSKMNSEKAADKNKNTIKELIDSGELKGLIIVD